MKTKKFIKIDKIIYRDGDIRFDLEVVNNKTTSSSLFYSPLKAMIAAMQEIGIFTYKEADNYCNRLHDDHCDIIETFIVSKIKEGLTLADEVRKDYYSN